MSNPSSSIKSCTTFVIKYNSGKITFNVVNGPLYTLGLGKWSLRQMFYILNVLFLFSCGLLSIFWQYQQFFAASMCTISAFSFSLMKRLLLISFCIPSNIAMETVYLPEYANCDHLHYSFTRRSM